MSNPFGNPEGDASQNPYGNNPYGSPQPNTGQGGQAGYPHNPSPNDPQQAGYQQPGYGYGGGYPQGGNPQYPGVQSQAGKFDAVNSLEQGWRGFKENPWPWILGMLIYGVIGGLIFLGGIVPTIMWSIENSANEATQPPFGSIIILILATVIFTIVMLILQAINTRNAVRVASGERISLRDFFTFDAVPKIFLVAFLVNIAVNLGSYLVIVGVIVAFLFMFAGYAAAVPGVGIFDAFAESFTVVKNNLGQALLFLLLAGLIAMLGVLALLIGTLVASPVIVIATAHAYLKATGRPVQERV
ncbi:hypothetical protein WG915_08720 [Corynebacterium sp. H128]|uniref:hypothetical protein n=1 Tax=unclassified Corynebacterium TaxID=2624378 RepID=UPI0030A18769